MKQRMQQNFSRYAAQYEAQAHFQRIQCARVADAALMLLPERARMLDVGCGTGMFRTLTVANRPNWQWLGLDIASGMCAVAKTHGPVLLGDAAQLPVADGAVDAVVSSLCLQWVSPLEHGFVEIQRVLRPGGLAVLASLGARTLHQLRAAAAAAGLPLVLLPMHEEHAYRTAIRAARLEIVRFDRRDEVSYYANVVALLDSMRHIGAGRHLPQAGGSLTGAKRWGAMLAHYEACRTPQGLPATWDMLFMIVRKPL